MRIWGRGALSPRHGPLLLGVFMASLDVRISHRAVRSEVRWALSLEQWRGELRVRAFAKPVGRP
jgi:hypothetical protein